MPKKIIARMFRLAGMASSYPEIITLINQDINPIASYCAVGATTVGLVADLEDSTNQLLTEQERQDASRQAGRKIALLIADIAVAIAYNAAVDPESFGAGAIATSNAIGIERTVNKLSAKFANALGLPEFQQKLGFGDGKPYQNISDIPSDAIMILGGYDFLIAATKYRATLEKKFEERTGLNINDALIVGRLGLRIGEAGLTAASGEIPDLEKVAKHCIGLARKFGIHTDKAKDFVMLTDLVQGSIMVANHIREGKFGTSDVKHIAKMAIRVAKRARYYGITPEFAQDAEAIANVVASTSNFVDSCIKGKIDTPSYSEILTSAEIAMERLFKRGAMLKQNFKDLAKVIKALRDAPTEDGKVDIHKILSVTKQIIEKGVEQELVSKKTQKQLGKTIKNAIHIPSQLIVAGKKQLYRR